MTGCRQGEIEFIHAGFALTDTQRSADLTIGTLRTTIDLILDGLGLNLERASHCTERTTRRYLGGTKRHGNVDPASGQ
ncbi:MAG: hypothetical protein JWN39_2326 [Ilumatobacteraceae bacterium]|nr:hypothetical protein [Ilumatobacteraceae bacterium]